MQATTIYTITNSTIFHIMYYIYIHTSRTSGKSYIGKSHDIEDRKLQHNWNAHNPNHRAYNTHFKRAIRLYGIDDFDTKILWCTPNEDTAYLAEVYYIAVYDTYKGVGYNSTEGGKGIRSGFTHTEESKEKMSKSLMGHITTQETKNKIGKGNRGKKRTQEFKNILSKAHTGLKHSEETIDKMSKSYIIIYPNKETKQIHNLAKFCRENNLNVGNMINILTNPIRHTHKGFSIRNV